MAQAEVDQKLFKLSKKMAVHVTDNAQVEFVKTPELKLMKSSVVTISGLAWKSLHEKHSDRIDSFLRQHREEQWEYHPHTKFVTVQRFNKGWQVALQTYTLSGTVMKAHNIFLQPEEWEKLYSLMPDISNALRWTQAKLGVMAREYIIKYGLEFDPMSGIQCPNLYFLEDHALEKAEELEEEFAPGAANPRVVQRLTTKPDPYELMRLLFLILYYRVGHLLNVWFCPACQGGIFVKGTNHVGVKGCQNKTRNIYSDYKHKIEKLLTDDKVLSVYRKCWSVLRLSDPVNSSDLLTIVRELVKDPNVICQEMVQISLNLDDLPDGLLIDDACNDLMFDKNVGEGIVQLEQVFVDDGKIPEKKRSAEGDNSPPAKRMRSSSSEDE